MDVIPVGPSPPFSSGTERNPFGGFCRKSSGPRVRPSPTSKPPREQRTLKRYETLGLLIASLLPPEQVVNSEPRRPLPSALLAPRSQRTSLSLPAPPLGPGPGRRSWHRGAQGSGRVRGAAAVRAPAIRDTPRCPSSPPEDPASPPLPALPQAPHRAGREAGRQPRAPSPPSPPRADASPLRVCASPQAKRASCAATRTWRAASCSRARSLRSRGGSRGARA